MIESDLCKVIGIKRQTLNEYRNGVNILVKGKPYSREAKLIEGIDFEFKVLNKKAVVWYTFIGIEKIKSIYKKMGK